MTGYKPPTYEETMRLGGELCGYIRSIKIKGREFKGKCALDDYVCNGTMPCLVEDCPKYKAYFRKV